MAKITLDLDRCVACGMCVNNCPDIFETDMSTLKVAIKEGKREGEVWTLETDNPMCAAHAAETCMMKAISVEE